MFCSYIIPTIGRESLDKAVRSVLGQQFPHEDWEVIVVNDSGQALLERAWLNDRRVSVLNTNSIERSRCRNSGAAVATGKYLAFLDDDDWILPGAIELFWKLANEHPSAVWLLGGINIVGEKGQILAEVNSGLNGYHFAQLMGGAWAPLQASMIKADAFFETGGFDPLINGTEDEDLARRICSIGDIASVTDPVGVLYRGATWSTSTNYQRGPEDTKFSRDRLLSQPRVFQKLWSSAASKYWRGRVVRVYLSTFVWNLKGKRLSVAISRAIYTLFAVLLSLGDVFSRDFWNGLRADHVPDSLHFVMLEQERSSLDQIDLGKTAFRKPDKVER